VQAYRDEGQYLAAASACRCAIRLGDADACSWEELAISTRRREAACAIEAYQQAIRALAKPRQRRTSDIGPGGDVDEAGECL